jgi:Xaa-Pro aminopeptidase
MSILSNDPDLVARRTGFDSWYHSLPAHLSLDGLRSELPVVHVPDNGRPTLMLKEIDRTNVELEKLEDVDVIFHNPYFTFDAVIEPTDAVADVVAAAERVIDGNTRVDPLMPVALHDALADRLGLEDVPDRRFVTPGFHYVVTRAQVARSFERGLRSIAEPASARIDRLGLTERLAPYLDAATDDDSFGPLDQMLEEAGIDLLLVSSPLNVQEVTGFPMRLVAREVWAAVERGSDEIHVMSRRELPWLEPGENRRESDYAARFARSTVVGYEEVDLSVEAAHGFGVDLSRAVPATELLRRWRERRSWRDAPFYVIAADVTRRGVEAALASVSHALDADRDVTEMDAYRRYRQTVREIIDGDPLPIGVETYFTHTHAGNRSLLPARATDHSLRPLTSLKIDAGLFVYDEFGLYRAVSDITRSVVGSDEARWFYDLLERALLEGVIDSCRAGTTGDAVFRAGMVMVEEHRAEVISAGFAPDVPSLTEGFKRDVGHLLGKQEPATVGLKLGVQGTVEAGMVAAAEFQWPYRDHCIGVEDIFLITEQEPVNLTRGQ